MRLGIVSPYSWTVPSGVNSHVTSLVGQLEKRGHDVWIVAPAGTLTHRAKNLPDNLIVAGTTVPIPSNGSVANVNIWPFMIQKMGRLLNRRDFDLLHVHEPNGASVGAAAVLAAKTPVVGTFHAAGFASNYYEHWRPMAARLLDCLTVRIAVSEAARDCVATHFPAEYRVIPNGIDVDTYIQARDGKREQGRILFLGRAEPRKGLAVLVEAFQGLRERMPWVSLTLVGTTYEQLHALVPRFSDEGAEKFRGIQALGRVSQERKIEQMRRAEILCAPSLGGESFGIILTEAMAAGLPVVASDIPGYRAVMAEGEAGVLVPPGNAAALEEALYNTLNDADLRRRLSSGGTERAESYSWEQVAIQVERAYEDALTLGPRVVEGPKVPVVKQAQYFLRTWFPNGKKPRAARSQAAG